MYNILRRLLFLLNWLSLGLDVRLHGYVLSHDCRKSVFFVSDDLLGVDELRNEGMYRVLIEPSYDQGVFDLATGASIVSLDEVKRLACDVVGGLECLW